MHRLVVFAISTALASVGLDAQTIAPPPPLDGRVYPAEPKNTAATYGEWYRSTTSDTAIVFVHGILSNNRAGWWYHDASAVNDSSRDAYWPELVAQDRAFGDPGIYLAGYYTAPGSGIYDVAQAARTLALELNQRDTLGRRLLDRRNIVFVTHSTGGLVVRYLLVHSQYLFHGKNVGLVLMASPALGSQYANRLGALVKLFGNAMGEELRTDNAFTRALFTDFEDLVGNDFMRDFAITGASACENHIVWAGILGIMHDQIVTPESCGAYFNAAVVIPATDHFSVVKPSTAQSLSHQFLVQFYTAKFVPLVAAHSIAPDTVRVTVDRSAQATIAIDSVWLGATHVLNGGACSGDVVQVVRDVPPAPWRIRVVSPTLSRVSDASAVAIDSAVVARDGSVATYVRVRAARPDANGLCAPVQPPSIALGGVMTRDSVLPPTGLPQVRLLLTRVAPRAVVTVEPLAIPPELARAVRWTYRAHFEMNGVTQLVSVDLDGTHETAHGLGAYLLADGRVLVDASGLLR